MGLRRPRAKQVMVDTGGFVNIFDAAIDEAQVAFDRTDVRVETLLVLPSQDLAAIVNAAANGSSFILAPGTHTLSTEIAFDSKSDITIRGPRNAVVTRTTGTAMGLCGNNAAFAKRIVLEGFTLRGNNLNGAVNLEMRGTANNGDHVLKGLRFESPGPNKNTAIKITRPLRDTQIIGCEFEGYFEYGIWSLSGLGTVVDHLQILGCKFNSFFATALNAIYLLAGPVSYAVVANNVIYGGNWNVGIGIYNMRDSVVVGNTIEDTRNTGIFGSLSTYPRNVIAKNVIYDPELDGISLSGSSGVPSYHIITKNVISLARMGIFLSDMHSMVVNYNSIANVSFDGIYLSNVDESTISGNMVKAAAGKGLTELVTCDQNLYVGNHLRGNGAATAFAGTNRTIFGNKV